MKSLVIENKKNHNSEHKKTYKLSSHLNSDQIN